MKKKIVRLNESEFIRLVEKVVRRVNKKPLRESRNRKRMIRENTSDMYTLEFYYTTGEEDYGDEGYDDSGYVEGQFVVNIPKSIFRQITGIDSITGDEEFEPCNSDEGGELLDYMLDSYYKGDYVISKNTITGRDMEPDIDCSWTQGVITVK
jgi:hypothetical protein